MLLFGSDAYQQEVRIRVNLLCKFVHRISTNTTIILFITSLIWNFDRNPEYLSRYYTMNKYPTLKFKILTTLQFSNKMKSFKLSNGIIYFKIVLLFYTKYLCIFRARWIEMAVLSYKVLFIHLCKSGGGHCALADYHKIIHDSQAHLRCHFQ